MHAPATPSGSHAIVIGAGMGGLVAARVLSSHFNRVTILERDTLGDTFDTRRGVPQGAHAHALLAMGLERLKIMFPGIQDDLVAAGGLIGDASSSMHWRQFGHLHARRESGIAALLSTRGLVETVVRRRLVQFAGIDFRDGMIVRGLTWNVDRSRATGVQARPTNHVNADLVDLPADLIVDATGRGSKLSSWLEDAGLPVPAEESVSAQTRYATRRFRAPFDLLGDTRIAIDVTSPARPMGGLATAQENGMWTVMLVGRAGVVPPTGLAAFTAFALALESPEIAAVVEHGEPLDDGRPYHFPASVRRRFDHMDRFPAGILPFADSICGFNPIYGQGMTIAVLEADILGQSLHLGTNDLFARFMTGSAPIIDTAWKLAASGDLPFFVAPETLPRSLRFITWYMKQVHAAAARDTEVAVAFTKVVHVLAPPTSMMSPRIVARVIRSGFRRKLEHAIGSAAPVPSIQIGPHAA